MSMHDGADVRVRLGVILVMQASHLCDVSVQMHDESNGEDVLKWVWGAGVGVIVAVHCESRELHVIVV